MKNLDNDPGKSRSRGHEDFTHIFDWVSFVVVTGRLGVVSLSCGVMVTGKLLLCL